jgi:hypothetical protein
VVTRIFSERQPYVAVVAFAAVILQGTAGLAFAAVYGFDVTRHADLGALIERGPGAAQGFRLALLVDMLAYLAVAPVVLHLHGRLRASAAGQTPLPWAVDVVGFAGLLFAIAGSIGATFLALAGSSLIDAAAAGGASEAAARVAFEAISRAVDEGLWGPLEWLAAGIWVGGLGWLLRDEGRRFAMTGMAAGVGALVYALRTGLTGRNPVETGEPIDLVAVAALGLFVIWELWLAGRLWLGR